jgi:hypothetical protein
VDIRPQAATRRNLNKRRQADISPPGQVNMDLLEKIEINFYLFYLFKQ